MNTVTADSLFAAHFAHLYPGKSPAEIAKARAEDSNPAKNPTLYAQMATRAGAFAGVAHDMLGVPEASLALDFGDASVHRLGAALTRDARQTLLGILPDGQVKLVPFVALAVPYVGECVVRNHRGAWQMRNPVWESLVRLESRAGTGDLAIFQWLLKSLADAEIDKLPLGDRYRTYVEVPNFDETKLEPIVAAPRKLPRLAKVKYDTLFKHLRAHLPELRDLGAHFPSPERFAELEFKWLDFALVGGGRMLVIHGPSREGVHVMWLDRAGFAKQAFYAADKFPEHVVRVNDDKGTLEVMVSIGGEMRVHETMWWGA